MFKKLKGNLKEKEAPQPQPAQLASEKSSYRPQQASYDQTQLHPNNPYYTPPQNQQNASISPGGYQPPPGPPPSYGGPGTKDEYAPPPGPPPSYPSQPLPSWDPPPNNDWTVIPDTALLPPPPSMGYDQSPTANASEDEGEFAYNWCLRYPLWPAQSLPPNIHSAVQAGQLALLRPPTFTGDLVPQRHPGHWKCRSHIKCKDSSLLTNLPLYSAVLDSPLRTGGTKTVYFEIKVLGIGRKGHGSSFEEADAGIAIGFVAPPYPTFRLPGWQRGSLGVHGDDGRKYVNDTFGGIDFTTSFQTGETIGLGIIFAPPRNPPGYGQPAHGMLDIGVFFTRNGVKQGGWDGNEELDAERHEGGTIGLQGESDLFGAVGVFGGVEFEVLFSPEQWLYNPF
ncbi:hypothetical protein P154DRAFT_557490 [Amniculicola lignicola CBS 123094]|uniref:SPRY domain-containing protein n=1 Tax=Amniculicola lignicola CBS 123094 TaxID=1392246 RepID=A0A6A5VVY3_9PLEO|nr:hypothetical protein P154DRAFT_557490 [Amniculicola lignicola CBS 123094]